MRFLDLAATSAAVGATPARRAKVELLAAALRAARPERGRGGRRLARRRAAPAPDRGRLGEPARPAAAGRRADPDRRRGRRGRRPRSRPCTGRAPRPAAGQLLGALFAAATAEEQRLLTGLFSGELRQGAQAGLLADAVARAAEVPPPPSAGRCCSPVTCARSRSPRSTAARPRWAAFGLQVGRPLAPMLAQSARRRGRGARGDRHRRRGRREARRHADPGAPLRRRHRRLHPQPRRHHRPGARDGRRGPGAARAGGGARRRGDRRSTRRPAAAPFQETSSRPASRGVAAGRRRTGVPAHAVLLRPAAPRRRRPDRRAAAGGAGPRSTTRSPASLLVAPAGRRPPGAGRRGVRRRARRRPGGRRGEGARRALRRRPARRRLGQGQAPAHPRPGGARRRVGPRPARGLAVQPAPRRPRPATGGFVMLGKTFKGLTDEMLRWQTERLPGARRRARRLGGHGPARAGGRDRLRRGADQLPLPGRDGAALRPGAALPRRQDGRPRPTPSTPSAPSTPAASPAERGWRARPAAPCERGLGGPVDGLAAVPRPPARRASRRATQP